MDFECSSSSSSSLEVVTDRSTLTNTSKNKKPAGRKKKRHPFYRGVRRRNSGKWVSEVREPNTSSRIWLGTFPTPESAAMAHDVATLALHGDSAAALNFPGAAHSIPRPTSLSHQDIKRAAIQAARDFTSLTFSRNASEEGIIESSSAIYLDSQNDVVANPLSRNSFNAKDDGRKMNVETSRSCGGEVEFVDEEAIFNMPLLVNSMAEGMLLTPPAMKKGFNWSQEMDDDDIDMTLWRE